MFRRAALIAAPCVIGGAGGDPVWVTQNLYIHTAVRSILYVVMHMDV